MNNIIKIMSDMLRFLPRPSFDAQIWDPLVKYLQSLPEDITKSDIYIKAESIDASTRYEEIQWITSYDISYVNTQNPEKYIQDYFETSSNISKYIQKVVLDDSVAKREKIVVLLSHFESYLHSKVEFDKGLGIKNKFRDVVKKDGGAYSAETIALAVSYAIVRIVFANTDNSNFDRRLPHRNDILHNGTLGYSDDEIFTAYTLLLSFICIIDNLIDEAT